jgi:hypothetical protein
MARSEAPSQSSAEVRRLWEEPTEEIGLKSDSVGILALLGRGGCQILERIQPRILSQGGTRMFLLRRIEFVVKDHRFGDAARFLQSFGSTDLAARWLSNDGVEFFVEKAA